MAKHKRGNNEGTICQLPNGKWRAQVSIDGHRLSKSYNTRRECQLWSRQKLNDRDLGYSPVTGNVQLKVYLSDYMERRKKELRPTTIVHYQNDISKHILPHIGEKKLSDLSLPMMDKYFTQLINNGIGNRTIHHVHSVLHKAFEDAIKYGYLLRNPVHGVSLPRVQKKEMAFLEENQVSQFLIAAKTSPLEVLFILAIVTGMRQGELLGLKWNDIQWNRGVLYITKQAQNLEGHFIGFADLKTNAGLRTIMIGASTLQALRKQKEHQALLSTFAGDKWQDNDLIFSSSIGTVLNPSNVRKELKRILLLANIPHIRFHDLRHTAASYMLNSGVPVIVVSKILGHASPSFTLDTYGHSITSSQDKAARIMDDLVTLPQIEVKTSSEESVILRPSDT